MWVSGKIAASVVIGLSLWWFVATAGFAVFTAVAADGIPTVLDLFSEVLPGWRFWGALTAISFS